MNKLIVKMVFGSQLYGTDTPESDQDFKGIAWPTRRQIFLGQIPKSINTSTKKGKGKNSSEDMDTEIYSLHYFMKLAYEGQTVAIDMLHAPSSALLEVTDLWREIVSMRQCFYTKNLHALVGYARRQAAKYGIKGSRLEAAQRALTALKSLPVGIRLADAWDQLPEGEYLTKKIDIARSGGTGGTGPKDSAMVWDVCGKILLDSAHVEHYIPMLEQFVQNYGNRARMAEQSEGIDWKAMSHAIRAAIQVKAILQNGGFEFPLPDAAIIKSIKSGNLKYPIVASMLEDLMDEVEALAVKSTLPEKVDVVAIENWLCQKIDEYLGPSSLWVSNIQKILPQEIQDILTNHKSVCEKQPGLHPGFNYHPIYEMNGRSEPTYLMFHCIDCGAPLGPWPVKRG